MKNSVFLFMMFSLMTNAQLVNRGIEKNKIIYFENISQDDFFEENMKALGLNSDIEMKFIYKNNDKNNNTHTKYKQVYKGVEVIGGTYFLHSKNGRVYKSSGNLYPNIKLPLTYTINEQTAINRFEVEIRNLISKDFFDSIENIDLFISDVNYICDGVCIIDKRFPDYSGEYRLAYKIRAINNSDIIPINTIGYIDANTAKTIFYHSKIYNTAVPAKGISNYYGLVDFISDSIQENMYVLHDLTRGKGIKVLNNLGNQKEFIDTDNFWDYNDVQSRSAIDVMYCSEKYYDFLEERFNRNSIDDNGLELLSYVGRKNYVNASWNGSRAVFGSGNCNLYGPLTTLSVVGHEFTHGLTDYTSDLVYFKESGALNESISDIFGEVLEHYYDNENFDWLIGGKFRKGDAKPFRSMKDPNQLGDPKFYKGKNWMFKPWDRYGVHTNSSVLNYWFYLISQGEIGINENGDTFNVIPIGIDKAIQIVYQVQVNYLTETSNYNDFYKYSIEVIKDLYGINSEELRSVEEAWKTVGLPNNKIYPEELSFLISYNGTMSPSIGGFCKDEIHSIKMELENYGFFDIPDSAFLSIDLNVYSRSKEIAFSDTFHFNKFFDKGLHRDSTVSFYFGLDSLALYDSLNYMIGFNAIVTVDKDSFKITKEFKDSLIFTDTYIDYKMKRMNLDFESCDGDSKIREFDISIINNGCKQFDLKDTIVMRYISSYDTIEYDFFRHSRRNELNTYKLYYNYYFKSIEDLNDYYFDLFIKTDGIKYWVMSDTFSKYIMDPLKKNEKLDFEDDRFKSILKITDHFKTDITTENKVLYFNSKDEIDPNRIESCLTHEEVFDLHWKSHFNRYLNKIHFCTDIEDMENPTLKFDVKMENAASQYSSINEFLHILKVIQFGEKLDTIIYDTGNQFVTVQLPLNKDLPGSISIDFVLHGVGILFDNIEVIDKRPSLVSKVAANYFIVTNPVFNRLQIKAPEIYHKWSINLYDINGNVIYHKNHIKGDLSFDVSLFPSGVYFYSIIDSTRLNKTGKVIIMK